ncbi:MAG: HAD family hydrolase [Lachnospiraceae bacterium]|nr:HAD family hydrolase [Lachnospiraceae bacterium]
MHNPVAERKMRVSFDLDEVLFVNPNTHETEPEPVFPLNKIFRERLRLGTPELIRSLQSMGYEVWIYTSSFRSEHYIRNLFRCYRVHFDGIVNGSRHLKEVQAGHAQTLPQKVPGRYNISLHIDDESVICSYGREYGFDAYQLDAPDEMWKEKIIEKAEQVKKKRYPNETVS